MKTANKLSSSLILTGAAAAALCVAAMAWQTKLTHKSNEAMPVAQTVSISAKRMTAEEKLAMDKNKANSTPAGTQFTQVKKPVRKIA